MSNGDCGPMVTDRESDLSNVLGRLDAVLGSLGCTVDTVQTRLIPVTRDAGTAPGGEAANAAPPDPPTSPVVFKLREFCERGERMNLQLQNTLERLEV